MEFMEWYQVLFIVIAAVVGIAAGFGLGVTYRKKVAEKEIGSAETEATRLINEAIRSGESRKKEMLLEAKDEIHKSRTEYERKSKNAGLSSRNRSAAWNRKNPPWTRKPRPLSAKRKSWAGRFRRSPRARPRWKS